MTIKKKTNKKNNKNTNKYSKIKKEKQTMYNFVNNKVFLATILFILTVLSLYINYVCGKKENFAIAEGVCKEDLPDLPEPEPTTTEATKKKCDSILVHGEVDEAIKEDIGEVISDVTESFLPKDCCNKEKILFVITEIEKILAQKSNNTNNSESKFNQTELLTIQEKTECSIETIKLVNILYTVIQKIMLKKSNSTAEEKNKLLDCLVQEIVKLCNKKSSTSEPLNFKDIQNMKKCGKLFVYILVAISDNKDAIKKNNEISGEPTDEQNIKNILTEQVVEGCRNIMAAEGLDPYELSEIVQNINNVEPSIKEEIAETVLDKVEETVIKLKDKVNIEKLKDEPLNQYEPKHYIETKKKLKKYIDENKLVFECNDIF